MTGHDRRRNWPQRVSRVLTPTALIVGLLTLASPVGASTPSSVALRVAQYALGTATHERPAQVVTAADVTNAAGISVVNPKGLDPLINLGDVYNYPRLVLFFEQKPFADICVNFPDTVGGRPTIIHCPREAQGFWDGRAGALSISNRAIANAAAGGRAVSGADVVTAAKLYGVTLRHPPTFLAGHGGTVDYATTVEMGANTKFTVNNCVRLPKTAYGIPIEVRC